MSDWSEQIIARIELSCITIVVIVDIFAIKTSELKMGWQVFSGVMHFFSYFLQYKMRFKHVSTHLEIFNKHPSSPSTLPISRNVAPFFVVVAVVVNASQYFILQVFIQNFHDLKHISFANTFQFKQSKTGKCTFTTHVCVHTHTHIHHTPHNQFIVYVCVNTDCNFQLLWCIKMMKNNST